VGISRGAIRLLGMAYAGQRGAGRVATFGVQKVEASAAEAAKLLGVAGGAPAPRGAGRIGQDALFRLLGFDAVESIDVYDAESPTHVLDLNQLAPASLHERFDLVYDGGTLEHCFSPAAVLGNATRLARPGGRVIHHVPLNNWIDHGFYQFSPTLFFDFYEANGFADLRMALHFMHGRRESWIPYEPRDGVRLPASFGGKSQVLAFFSARRAQARAEIVFPIQGRYRRAFGGETATAAARGLARLRRSLARRTWRLRARPL
jgi:SAM-dependent methyltransferase